MVHKTRILRRTATALLVLTFCLSGAALAQESTTPVMAVIDINTASALEIEGVVGDPELAQRIVASRPFANKRQLVSRELMPLEAYDKVKDRLVARRLPPAPEDAN